MSVARLFLRPLFVLVALIVLGAMASAACSSELAPIPEVDASPEPTQPPTPKPPPPPSPTTTDPDTAKPPVITKVTPDKAVVGSQARGIVVTGNNFVARSVIQVGGGVLKTDFVSASELKAEIPSDRLLTVGILKISVGTSAPGGGGSNELPFEVQNPSPQLTQIAPLSVVAGSPATPLELTGTGFVDGAKVTFNGKDLTATFESSTKLKVNLQASLLATAGSFPVKVTNPAPGGGTSTAISFTVTNPTVTLTRVTPSTSPVNGPAVSITLEGTGFLPASSILFNGTLLTTKNCPRPEQCTAQIPAAQLTAAGEFGVVVSNPAPGGGVSAPVPFRVLYSAPVLTGVAPSTIPVGSGSTTVTVTGSNFYPGSQISFDNVLVGTTTHVNATTLQANLLASALVNAGSIAVRVVNPTPGGGTSSAVSISVQNPAPVITTLSPSSTTVGSPDRTISVLGSGFVGGASPSVVKANSSALATTVVNGTQITFTLPSTYFMTPGTVSITVTNPSPGGGTSLASFFTVGCDTTDVDVQLGALGNTTTLPTNFAAATIEGHLGTPAGGGVCPGSLVTTSSAPARYIVVQNTATVPVTLSAWAVCTGTTLTRNEDALLAFYKRSTRPVTDAEKGQCVGIVSEGPSGPGGLTGPAPDNGGSAWCPGLTKANRGGMLLSLCEKAVVRIQPYSMTDPQYPPPASIRFRPE